MNVVTLNYYSLWLLCIFVGCLVVFLGIVHFHMQLGSLLLCIAIMQ